MTLVCFQQYDHDNDLPEKAPNNVLKQSNGLLLDQLVDHVAEHGAYSVESLISLADILQSKVVQKYFLNNEDGNSLAKLAASLHDT